DPHAQFVAQLLALLDDPRFHASALAGALDYGQAAAYAAWENAEEDRPVERLATAIRGAAAELQRLAADLTAPTG
ncbi:MAG TPA: hypothetical protein VFW33_09455, partial [Gemmataceae bacterium]|nr:hypothetical protein [Gemmataceae bacterium]